MANYALLTTGTQIPYANPSFTDYELALRILSGAELRPNEGLRAANPDPELHEAMYRVQHALQHEITAARACLLALTPEAIEALGDLLTDKSKPQVRLGALKFWGAHALPNQTQRVEHTIDPKVGEIAGQAAVDFHRLTQELDEKIKQHRTIDITQSKHIFRGSGARPVPGIIERPDPTSDGTTL